MLTEIKKNLKSIFRNRRIPETPKLRCKCTCVNSAKNLSSRVPFSTRQRIPHGGTMPILAG